MGRNGQRWLAARARPDHLSQLEREPFVGRTRSDFAALAPGGGGGQGQRQQQLVVFIGSRPRGSQIGPVPGRFHWRRSRAPLGDRRAWCQVKIVQNQLAVMAPDGIAI